MANFLSLNKEILINLDNIDYMFKDSGYIFIKFSGEKEPIKFESKEIPLYDSKKTDFIKDVYERLEGTIRLINEKEDDIQARFNEVYYTPLIEALKKN